VQQHLDIEGSATKLQNYPCSFRCHNARMWYSVISELQGRWQISAPQQHSITCQVVHCPLVNMHPYLQLARALCHQCCCLQCFVMKCLGMLNPLTVVDVTRAEDCQLVHPQMWLKGTKAAYMAYKLWGLLNRGKASWEASQLGECLQTA